MRQFFTLLGLIFFLGQSFAQDTIVVQTFTWDSTSRAEFFTFPDDPDQTYRKILMRYNMRCHDVAVGSGNVGCREWDYSCNTFITDPSRTDSIMATHPSHLISNFSGDFFDYTTQPTYTYYSYDQQNVTLGTPVSETVATVGQAVDTYSADNGQTAAKSQFLVLASELTNNGLTAGDITGLQMHINQPGEALNFLRVALKATSKTELDAADPDLDGFTEVYFANTEWMNTGANQLNFYQNFNWDGTSNLIVEYSYTNNAPITTSNILDSEATGFNSVLNNRQTDQGVDFAGAGTIEVPADNFNTINNEITISLWCYGTPDVMPTNSTIFEGRDASDHRQVNVHLPWGNGRVYWDCGGDNGAYDRIEKAANPADFEGQWNHWAFTKNATTGEMHMYLNGELWHSGSDRFRPIDIQNFNMGSDAAGNNNYYGTLNEVRVWDKELDQTTIQEWMLKTLDPSHPDYGNLIAYFPLDEGTGTTTQDASPAGVTADIVGFPNWKRLRGSQLYKDFEVTINRPVLSFVQGTYSNVTITPMTVIDSVENALHSVTSFEVQGTDLVAVDTIYVYPAGDMSVIDESGTVVGTVPVAAESSVEITTLDYYRKFDAKFEILSLVTPYGNGLDLGPEGATFTFDVTDYGPILRGEKFLSLEMGGQNQEEMDIQFLFITGTPERDVIDIQNVWRFQRGWYQAIMDDAVFEPRELTLRADGDRFELRSAITGHGQNGEFIPRNHYININGGNQEFVYEVWKECADNPMYPQGGTWLFDRAGWCPGEATDVHRFDIGLVAGGAGNTITIDYGVNGGFLDAANYLVSNQLVTYGPVNNNLDASIENIKQPTTAHEYGRFNPICSNPIVMVRNTGATGITSLELRYQVKGTELPLTYTFDQIIQPGLTKEVTLPVDFVGFWVTDEPLEFEVEILSVNGETDGNPDNDYMSTPFELPDIFGEDIDLLIKLRTNNRANENSYTITNSAGEIVMSRNGMTNNTTYEDDIDLPPGCYTLTFDDTADDGLSYWFDPAAGSGYFRMAQWINDFAVTLRNFESEFGGTVYYDFVVGELSNSTTSVETPTLFSAYPNPAYDELTIEWIGEGQGELYLQVTNLTGQVLHQAALPANTGQVVHHLDVHQYPAGMYYITLRQNSKSYVRPFVKQ
jgi:hypothetical protein